VSASAIEKSLEQVIADYRGEAAVLRRRGSVAIADAIEEFADHVARASEDYLTWLSEADAIGRSGKSVAWLRRRYPGWFEMGHARYSERNARAREYRQAVIPQRLHIAAMRDAARRDAERTVHAQQRRAS
jgi:hypothetical protein